MSCCFQGGCLVPEGGAPADWTLHASWRGVASLKRSATGSAWHLVQGAFLLLPLGTTYQGTGKQYSVGEVQGVLPSILPQGQGIGKGNRPLAEATAPHRQGAQPCGLRRAKAHFCQGGRATRPRTAADDGPVRRAGRSNDVRTVLLALHHRSGHLLTLPVAKARGARDQRQSRRGLPAWTWGSTSSGYLGDAAANLHNRMKPGRELLVSIGERRIHDRVPSHLFSRSASSPILRWPHRRPAEQPEPF